MAGERVLVVDDSRVYRDLVTNHILDPNGYESLAAADGEEGLQLARSKSPDLIVLDMLMPKLNGVQVLEALHKEKIDIPVILMTVHGSEEAAVTAFRHGAKDYVIKPFEVDELLEAMERALTEVRLRREKEALTRELEAQHRQLEAVLANTKDAVILIEDGEHDAVILVNDAACQAFGIEADAAGRPLAQVVRHETLLKVFKDAKRSSEPTHSEILLADGRTLNANVTPIPGVGRAAVMQDITHLKQLDQMKSEFVTTVSHDLRSPLTTIKGFADLLAVAGPLNEHQQTFAARIQRGVDNLTEMVTDLLDLGRIESEVSRELELCGLETIVEKVVSAQKLNASIKGQSLVFELEPDLPPVYGSPLRLTQALSNLVSNSIKYTPEGGQISITGNRRDGHVVVAISDDGIGIPPADRPYIFDKFYRVKSAETDHIVGSGLGLALVKSIIEKHNGRIWVRSQLGEGSVFSFMLPIAE